MTIVRVNPLRRKQNGGNFAKGKKAIAIDQRTGFKHLQRDMDFEPGTDYFVHKRESDGKHNLVTDPLNFYPELTPEKVALRYVSRDAELSVGTVTSADALAIVEGLEPGANFEGYYLNTEASASTD